MSTTKWCFVTLDMCLYVLSNVFPNTILGFMTHKEKPEVKKWEKSMWHAMPNGCFISELISHSLWSTHDYDGFVTIQTW